MTTVSTIIQAPSESFRADATTRPLSLLRRVLQAFVEARQRQADRLVAEILSRQGGIMAHSEANERQSGRRTFPFHQLPALKSD
jgi:hypothetical protein